MLKRYQVLARKYRPQTFQEVVGQEAVVTTLKNAIRFDQVAHAYLFCGTRGVGKTTLARLFAKALNCQALTENFEPCNGCPSCLEISSGQSLDVIEIDGASNRGIDDIRQINETVGYAPSHGRYKIYIIDEVHMLTKEAFNALLKTLEEPPPQAKFFFATTEAHKVLPTIISRCQRFDLASIQPHLIVSKLQQIATDMGRPVEVEALQLIASFSEGSLRDAESLLDQIFCFSAKEISAAIVRETLGLAPKELFSALDEAFASSHLPFAFELVEKLLSLGKDLAHFFDQLIEHYRNIVQKKERKIYTEPQALHILDLLILSESAFQKSSVQRTSLESILLQIIRSKNRIPIEVLVRHLTERSPQIELPTTTTTSETPEKKAEHPLPPKIEQVFAPPPPPPTQAEPPTPQPTAPILKPVPFHPQELKKKEETPQTPLAQKHPSHYDTLIRFAAVEFEGTIKK